MKWFKFLGQAVDNWDMAVKNYNFPALRLAGMQIVVDVRAVFLPCLQTGG